MLTTNGAKVDRDRQSTTATEMIEVPAMDATEMIEVPAMDAIEITEAPVVNNVKEAQVMEITMTTEHQTKVGTEITIGSITKMTKVNKHTMAVVEGVEEEEPGVEDGEATHRKYEDVTSAKMNLDLTIHHSSALISQQHL